MESYEEIRLWNVTKELTNDDHFKADSWTASESVFVTAI